MDTQLQFELGKKAPLSNMIAHVGPIGIIDIGSNSIRLVIYDQQKRSPVPIYNEKVMCELGKGLAASGVLNPEGVEMAKQSLRRFVAMGHNMEIDALYVVATAAIRDAKDGASFAAFLEKEHKISIDIISGAEEARWGAYGVCASVYRPNGITGDLGGGSLELVKLEDGNIVDHASILLGSLRMIDETKGDRDKLRKLVEKRFGDLHWLEEKKAPAFYAIGGSFRALAKMHMEANNYPLHVLHEYKVETKSFLNFVRDIASMSFDKMEKFPGVAIKRIPALPGAAIALEYILQNARPNHIIFSASGIREGYLYEKLSPEIRHEDGLLSSCAEFATQDGQQSTDYAYELYAWMQPLFSKESESERRLRLAFCLLSDVALHIHPEYRAEWAYHRVLCSAMTSLTHHERVKLSLALYHRYQFRFKESWPSLALLQSGDRTWAKLVGSAANLAYHLSGSIAGNLPYTTFVIEKTQMSLEVAAGMQDALGDAIKRRLEGVREAYANMYNPK